MNLSYAIDITENNTLYVEDYKIVYAVNRTFSTPYLEINSTYLQIGNQSFNYSDYNLSTTLNLTENLYKYYSMDQDLNDTLTYDPDLMALNDPNNAWELTENGLFGNAFYLDTDKRPLEGNYTYPPDMGDRSWSVWFNVQEKKGYILNLEYVGPGWNNGIDVYIGSGTDVLWARVGNAGSPNCDGGTNFRKLWDFSTQEGNLLNEWNNIIYTQNDTNGYFYVNGVLANDTINASCNLNQTGYITPAFGGLWQSGYDSIKGTIDDIRIYNISLTQDQINQITNLSNSDNTTRRLFNVTVNIKRTDTLSLFEGNVSLNSTNGNSYSLIDEFATGGTTQIVLTDDLYNYTITGTDFDDVTGSVNITYLNESIDFFVTPTPQFDNCSSYSGRIMNFTMFAEDTGLWVNGNASGYFEFMPAGYLFSVGANLTWTDVNNFSICVRDILTNYTIDGQMEYITPGYNKELYYWDDRILYNSTEYVPLYFTANATSVTFTVKDQDDTPIQGILINILEYDLTKDNAIVTEIISTDNNGQAVGNVVLDDKRYKFILTLKDVIVLETVDTIIQTTEKSFRINLAEDYMQNYDTIRNTICTVTYDPNNYLFEYIFLDSAQEITQSCLEVIKRSALGDIPIETSCLTTTSGQINVNISGQNLNNEFIGQGFVYIDDELFTCDVESYSYSDAPDKYGLYGILMSLFIFITLIGISIRSPIIAVVLSSVGIVIVNILGIFHLNTPILMAFIFSSIMAVYKMSKVQR